MPSGSSLKGIEWMMLNSIDTWISFNGIVNRKRASDKAGKSRDKKSRDRYQRISSSSPLFVPPVPLSNRFFWHERRASRTTNVY